MRGGFYLAPHSLIILLQGGGTVGVFDSFIRAWKEAGENEKYFSVQWQRQAALHHYWERYWLCALVIWEIIYANYALLKIQPQKEPKWLKLTAYSVKDTNTFHYVLNRVNVNTPVSDGAVLPHEVSKVINDYLIMCGFTSVCVECVEDTYKYYLAVGGSGFTMGKPMSNKIGKLFVNRFYDAFNNLYYNAFDVRYFDNSTYGGIRDNIPISLYHEGQFLQTITSRDISGNPCLSRLPFKLRTDFDYLVIV